MQISKINSIIEQGERIHVEFKECRNQLSNEVFETVCAFLNRFGGELLLGVNDAGRIIGINKEKVEQIKKDFATAINNPQIVTPTFYLSLEEVTVGKKVILYVYVPESSQVHKYKGRIIDRNEDGDFDITENSSLVTSLYVRKQTTYSENKVYPYVTLKDLRSDLIEKTRKLARIQNPGHPWADMDDIELLKSAQLYLKDYSKGEEGFTLASILLFGKDEVIMSVLPHHRTDAIVRIKDTDRYDDRDDIRTNLIESYDRIMAFVNKHLPDKFYLEDEQRINIRDHIFREVVGNILIHREYTNPFPAKFIIERDRVYTENSNRPHGHGLINPANFSPFPKNPVIARIFKEIGRADELGSGVKKLFKYCKIYSGSDPELIEEDIFKTIVPLDREIEAKIGGINGSVKKKLETKTVPSLSQVCPKSISDKLIVKILNKLFSPTPITKLMEVAGQTNRTRFRNQILKPLIKREFVRMTIPNKPKSPKQKYVITDKGKRVVEERRS